MKQLKDLMVKRFRCDYCKKITRTSKGMEGHEYRCYYNPNRSCDTCQGVGVEMLATLGANLGVIFDRDERLCPSCSIAERVGGKSYITQETKDSFGIKVRAGMLSNENGNGK